MSGEMIWYIIGAGAAAFVGIGMYQLATESHEQKWRRQQAEAGRSPQQIETEATLRREMAWFRNALSDEIVKKPDLDFEKQFDNYLEITSKQLEREQPRLGKIFLALVESLDLKDILTPTAYNIVKPKQEAQPYEPPTLEDRIRARQIDRAAFGK